MGIFYPNIWVLEHTCTTFIDTLRVYTNVYRIPATRDGSITILGPGPFANQPPGKPPAVDSSGAQIIVLVLDVVRRVTRLTFAVFLLNQRTSPC